MDSSAYGHFHKTLFFFESHTNSVFLHSCKWPCSCSYRPHFHVLRVSTYKSFTVFAGKKYQFQMCRTDFTTWITETLYTHCLQVRYIPSFLAVQLCTLCHHYLVFLYMFLSVMAVILFSFVFCLILVILQNAPKSKSTKKSILLLHIQSMSKC